MASAEGPVPWVLRCGIVLRVQEDEGQILRAGTASSAGFTKAFPSPRVQRVSPGHLVAVVAGTGGAGAVVWWWYDAVVLGEEAGLVRLWEPAHGEVVAHPRRARQHRQPGTRAYLSAGLPGAGWWVAGAVAALAPSAISPGCCSGGRHAQGRNSRRLTTASAASSAATKMSRASGADRYWVAIPRPMTGTARPR
jgi:hypothetical protein